MLRSTALGALLALASLGSTPTDLWIALDAPTVTLRDPGATPRRALRYALHGDPSIVTRTHGYEAQIRGALGVRREEQGQIRLELEVQPVSPSGASPIEVAIKLRAAEVLGVDTASLLGTGGLVRYDDRGRPVEARWEVEPSLNAAQRAALEQLRERASELALPLPEEPVGPGATWEIRDTLHKDGARFVTITICTLREDRPDGLDVQCRFSHERDGSSFSIVRAGRPRQVHVKDSSIEGQSILLQSLDALTPVREDGDLQTFVHLQARLGVLPTPLKVQTIERWSQITRL